MQREALAGQVGKQVPRALAAIIGRFVERSAQYIAAAEFEDAIRIAGQIATWIGILGAITEICEATADILLSPSTYLSTLTLTHDVTVKIPPTRQECVGARRLHAALETTFSPREIDPVDTVRPGSAEV